MSNEGESDTVDDLPAIGAAGRAGVVVRADVGGRTHEGLVRPTNEDNFHALRFGRYLQTISSSLPAPHTLEEFAQFGYGFCVADGVGGGAAGDVASRRAITLLIDLVLRTPDWLFAHEDLHLEVVMDRYALRFGRVNAAVVAESRADPKLRGMATTLSLAVSLGDNLIVAHVGDSPVFLLRGGRLERLNRDHTTVEARSAIRPGDAAWLRTALTHAIGIPDTGGLPDITRVKLVDGDRLLLCTDGLTDLVDVGTIADGLGRGSADDACAALVDRALERGGKDNVTVVVAAYQFSDGPAAVVPGG
jgi:protein phosphatase